MGSNAFKIAKFLIGWPLSLLALFFIFQLITPRAKMLLSDLHNLNIGFLSIGILFLLLFYFIRGYIWYRLLQEKNYKIHFSKALSLWAVSELKRYIPGKFWFILGRASAFSGIGIPKKETSLLLVIELQIFALGALCVSLLSIPFLKKYFIPSTPFSDLLMFLSFLITGLLLIAYIYNRKFLNLLTSKTRKIIGAILPDNSPDVIYLLLLLSSLALVFFGLGNYFVISSVTFLDPQLLPQLIGYFTLSFFLGFLSILTPAGLGVREGAMAIGLGKLISASQGAFSSILARIILVITELIFISLALVWEKINFKKFKNLEKNIQRSPHTALLIFFVILYVLYFNAVSISRYDQFYTGRFDLGNMAQTVWNTSQGRIFLITDPDGTEIVSRLSFHADFILILLAPFYYIWANPKILLIIQTLFLSAGAFFIYLLALDFLKNKNLALIFSLVYLMNPALQRVNIYDFHAVALSTFFLLGTFYFCRTKKYFVFTLFAFLSAITKEEIWLIIALFGLYIYISAKKRLFGGLIFLLSSLMFYFLIWHAIPQTRGAEHFALSYYSELGATPEDIIKTAIFSPLKILAVLLSPERLDYLKPLFSPLGYLSILSPFYLIFALPDLMINLLSNNSKLHEIYYQYSSSITPFIFISAISGLGMLIKITKLPDIFFITYLLFTAFLGAYLYSPLPGARDSNLVMFTKPMDKEGKIEKLLSNIPREASITATNNIASHLSEREKIYVFPQGIDRADYIIFLINDSLKQNLEREMIKKLKQNTNYLVYSEDDKFLVFVKKAP